MFHSNAAFVASKEICVDWTLFHDDASTFFILFDLSVIGLRYRRFGGCVRFGRAYESWPICLTRTVVRASKLIQGALVSIRIVCSIFGVKSLCVTSKHELVEVRGVSLAVRVVIIVVVHPVYVCLPGGVHIPDLLTILIEERPNS